MPKAKEYLPEDCNLKALSLDYLFTVRIIINFQRFQRQLIQKDRYILLYNLYKQKLSNNSYKKWCSYQVFVSEEIAEKLKNFVPLMSKNI